MGSPKVSLLTLTTLAARHLCHVYNIVSWVMDSKAGVVQVNLCQKLFFLQNMGRTCCVQKLFSMSETISVHNMFSPGLSLEFSCIELVCLSSYCGLVDAKIRASDKDLPVNPDQCAIFSVSKNRNNIIFGPWTRYLFIFFKKLFWF